MAAGAWIEFSTPDEAWLMQLARQSLEMAVRHRSRPLLHEMQPAALLREPRGCFVTLEKHGALRGCIGSLQAERPLFEQVADKTWRAALDDPRFAPVVVEELDGISIALSILDQPREIEVSGIEELAAHLQPGKDGLILREGVRQATFLPAVWEKLPRSADFIAELQRKGGWPRGYWSVTMRASIYRTHSIDASSLSR
jgi:AmmeMemoRadiSam system protein A